MTCDQSSNIDFEMNVQNNNVNAKQNRETFKDQKQCPQEDKDSSHIVSSVLEGLMCSVIPQTSVEHELDPSCGVNGVNAADRSEPLVASFLDDLLEKIVRDSIKPWMTCFEFFPRERIPLWEPCEEYVGGEWVLMSQARRIFERERELETLDLSGESGKIDKSWSSRPKGPPLPGSKRARYSNPVPQPTAPAADTDSDDYSDDDEYVSPPSPKRKAIPSPTMTAETLQRLRACGGISVSRSKNEPSQEPSPANVKSQRPASGTPKVNLPPGVTISQRNQNGEPMVNPRRPMGVNLPSGISITPASAPTARVSNLPPGISVTTSASSSSRDPSISRNSVDSSSEEDEHPDSDSLEEEATLPPKPSPEKSKAPFNPSQRPVKDLTSGPPAKKRKLNHNTVEDALACLFMLGLLWARKSAKNKKFDRDTGLAVEEEDSDDEGDEEESGAEIPKPIVQNGEHGSSSDTHTVNTRKRKHSGDARTPKNDEEILPNVNGEQPNVDQEYEGKTGKSSAACSSSTSNIQSAKRRS